MKAHYQPGYAKSTYKGWITPRRQFYYPVGPAASLANFQQVPASFSDNRLAAGAPGFGGILFG